MFRSRFMSNPLAFFELRFATASRGLGEVRGSMALLPVGDQLRGLQSQGSSSVMWTNVMLTPQSRKKIQLIPEKGSIFDQNPEILPWYMPQISRHSQNWTFLDTVFSGPGEPIKNLVVSLKDRYKISRTKPVILSRINCGAQKTENSEESYLTWRLILPPWREFPSWRILFSGELFTRYIFDGSEHMDKHCYSFTVKWTSQNLPNAHSGGSLWHA